MGLFLELKKMYEDMEIQILKESEYIADNSIRDEKELLKILDQKKILRDKIEKKQKKTNEKLLDEERIELKVLVLKLLKLEEENRKKYNIKLESTRKKIVDLIKEKKLKTTYFKPNNLSNRFDKKK